MEHFGWLNNKRTTTEYYDSKNPILKIISKWSKDIEDWVGVTRQEWHYTDAGLNDSIRNFRFENNVWNPTTRTVNKYDENKNNILTHNADWNGEKWVMSSMTRLDISDKTINGIRQVLQASWKCSADSIWKGDQKDTVAYLTDEKLLFRARYSSWSNGNWIPAYKIEYEYDEAQRNTLQQRLEWTNGAWVGKYRYEKLYDSAGRELLNASYDGWDASRQDWIGNSKTTTTYNAEGKTETQTTYRWRGSQWEPLFTNQYGYDANGREVDVIVQMYLFENWINTNRTLKEYQGSMLIKENEYIWKSNQWVLASRNETYYDNDAQHKLRREVHGAWNNGAVTSFEHYYYMYSCDPCIIRFVNYDGTELESKTMDKGQKPSYTGETPTKPEDVENTYTFDGWTPEITPVTCSVTYTATFKATKKTYTITWLNDDNSLIEETTVEYGKMPTHVDATKANTAEFTYEFNGWTPGIGIVTGDATYTATYKETKNSYTITWLNDDNSQIDQTTVAYGETPTHADAEKSNTAEWTYTFAGWDPEVVSVTGNATYKATFNATKNSYTITWKNEDGSVIESETLEYGLMPQHTDPSKDNTAEWTYSFSGWTPEIASVTGDAEYTATFSATKNKYTITFLNYDGTELQSGEVEYGVKPTYNGADPTKPADAQDTYTFAGWAPQIQAVTGDATYTAVFDATPIDHSAETFIITFYYEDGKTILEQVTVAYGEIPVCHYTPSMVSDAEHYYTFTGWSPEVVPATSNASYTPTFQLVARQYTITFKNYDNKELMVYKEDYGEMPTYTGETPTKKSTQQYDYVFVGWSPELAPVTKDAVYKAKFESVLRTYTVIYYDEDGETELDREEVGYGRMPIAAFVPTKYSYYFAGWSPRLARVTKDASYTATYTATPKTQGIDEVESQESRVESRKVIIDNKIYILRGGHIYTVTGQKVQ